MKYVYILKSIQNEERHYTGVTDDIEMRVKDHNAGKVKPSKAFVPWKLETYVGFSDDDKAFAFEKYLKSGSGRAFAKKHL